jgi:lipopolysaccharide transport system ATP-binding protein
LCILEKQKKVLLTKFKLMSSVISVENLSKKYLIKHEAAGGYGMLSETLLRPFKSLSSKKTITPSTSEEFFALKDLSFELKIGERLGIIGRNGAGKSTLLKVLSRITEPTSGSIKIRGRVASLLEVGTGFHPELTGRENIFLNGAILGMSRTEIKSKFDEIVSFSEVERFLDTPVKRYSSGMYVRLAFAVAAHLEPEILIVDEVLAVGDAKFQQKCLGKMEDVSKEGRTVLFVSHNMSTLKSLCSSILYLKDGQLVKQGPVEETIKDYLAENQKVISNGNIPRSFKRKYNCGHVFIDNLQLINSEGLVTNELYFGEPFTIRLGFTIDQPVDPITVQINVANHIGENILSLNQTINGVYQFTTYGTGKHFIDLKVDAKYVPNNFNLSALLVTQNGTPLDWVEFVYPFTVSNVGVKLGTDYPWAMTHGYAENSVSWKNVTL